jgi:mRNA interferase RelE/StbE
VILVWKIEFDPSAKKELLKLDPQIAKRILKFLKYRLSIHSDPRELGEAIKGSKLGEFWKYRVGDYRIIANINDKTICILVLRIGNRKEVYK